jgi:hypothetical protein
VNSNKRNGQRRKERKRRKEKKRKRKKEEKEKRRGREELAGKGGGEWQIWVWEFLILCECSVCDDLQVV